YFARTTFLGVPLDTHGAKLGVNLAPDKDVLVGLAVVQGSQEIYDFQNPRVGNGRLAVVAAYLYPQPTTTLVASYTKSTVWETTGPKIADADIMAVSATYQRAPSLGFKAYAQYSDQWTGLVADPLLQESALLRSSVLMTYEMATTSFLYFG